MYAYFPQTTLRHALCYDKVKDKDLTPFTYSEGGRNASEYPAGMDRNKWPP